MPTEQPSYSQWHVSPPLRASFSCRQSLLCRQWTSLLVDVEEDSWWWWWWRLSRRRDATVPLFHAPIHQAASHLTWRSIEVKQYGISRIGMS